MKTVLVVEDEKLIRKGLATMIRRAPTPVETVLEAKNGLQALEILHEQPVDVMITDIRMPGMDGIELVNRTRSLPHVPLCVVVSGYDDFNYAVEMMRGGVKDYLLKPVERERLYRVLSSLDDALRTAEKEQQTSDTFRLQALRYLMLDGSVPDNDRRRLIERYGPGFGTRPYRVLCAATMPANLPVRELLRDIRGRFVLVLETDTPLPVLRGGVSAMHTGLAELHAAYTEAENAFRRAYFDGLAALRPATPLEPDTDEVAEKELQKIVQPLGVGRWQEASAALRALVTRVQQDRLSPEGFGRAVQQLGRQIMTSYRTMLDADTAEMNVLTDPWQYDCAESYLTAVRAWMERFTHRLLHEFDDYRNKQKIRDAVLYIQENYATPLNMALVSNEVDMNYSLFSLLFKQYVGTNFVAYLQGLRLTEAKRLLRETDLRVNEIGRRVGFTDDKNFLEVFKSAEGVSPTEYRRASQFGQ